MSIREGTVQIRINREVNVYSKSNDTGILFGIWR